eukprot:960239-Amphidinium_carterae.1
MPVRPSGLPTRTSRDVPLKAVLAHATGHQKERFYHAWLFMRMVDPPLVPRKDDHIRPLRDMFILDVLFAFVIH